MKETMIAMGDSVKKRLPNGFGFALIVFPFGGPAISNYISNAEREDMIKALRETANLLESKKDFKTPSSNSN